MLAPSRAMNTNAFVKNFSSATTECSRRGADRQQLIHQLSHREFLPASDLRVRLSFNRRRNRGVRRHRFVLLRFAQALFFLLSLFCQFFLAFLELIVWLRQSGVLSIAFRQSYAAHRAAVRGIGPASSRSRNSRVLDSNGAIFSRACSGWRLPHRGITPAQDIEIEQVLVDRFPDAGSRTGPLL